MGFLLLTVHVDSSAAAIACLTVAVGVGGFASYRWRVEQGDFLIPDTSIFRITRKLFIASNCDWSQKKRHSLEHILMCSCIVVRFFLSDQNCKLQCDPFLKNWHFVFEFSQKPIHGRNMQFVSLDVFWSFQHFLLISIFQCKILMHHYGKWKVNLKKAGGKWRFWVLHGLFHIWLKNRDKNYRLVSFWSYLSFEFVIQFSSLKG